MSRLDPQDGLVPQSGSKTRPDPLSGPANGIAGQLPPHDLNAEAAILGAVLTSGDLLEAIPDLAPEAFYAEAHRRVYEACRDLYGRDVPVDIVSVTSELRATKRLEQVGGAGYLTELLNAAPSLSRKAVQGYASTVSQRATARALISACWTTLSEAYACDGDVTALVHRAEELVHKLGQSSGHQRATTLTMRQAVTEAFKDLRDHYEHGGGIQGISTGFPDLDYAIGGLHRGDLTILAARPGMGKTSLMMRVLANVAQSGKGAMVFSLEMPNKQLAVRAICSDAGIDIGAVRNGRMNPLDWQKLTAAVVDLAKSEHFVLDDDGSSSMVQIRTKARKWQRECEAKGIESGVLAVDYLQLVNSQREHREQAISEVSRGLKALAKELHVPVVALSQLNRAVESRSDKRPMLQDLRESGAIEQDADNILFVYRDDYYNPKSEHPGTAEILIGKQRNGPTGVVMLGFRKESATFHTIET